jgi:hypothetical protein
VALQFATHEDALPSGRRYRYATALVIFSMTVLLLVIGGWFLLRFGLGFWSGTAVVALLSLYFLGRPDSAALAVRASALAQAGSWHKAAKAAKQSLHQQQDEAVAVLLGDCLFNSSSNGFLAAEAAYRQAIALRSRAAHRGLGECLARKHEFDEAQKSHDLWFRNWINGGESVQLRYHQQRARERGVPPIAIVAMQKSASEFIMSNLVQALDAPMVPVSIGTIPVDRALPSALRQMAKGGALFRSHMSGDNVQALAQAGLDRMLLHVRDPRQVTVSWTHMMKRISPQEFVYASHMYNPSVPDDFRNWRAEQQLDWAIENYLPGQLKWLQVWATALESPPLSIYVTTFEEFRNDNNSFYERVLDFFCAPVAKPEALMGRTPQAMRNFRKGSTSEWRELFSPAQKRSLEPSLAPFAERFGWPQ